jgi:hypothetical protein
MLPIVIMDKPELRRNGIVVGSMRRLLAALVLCAAIGCSADPDAEQDEETIDATGDWVGETSEGKVIGVRVAGRDVPGALVTWFNTNPGCSARHAGQYFPTLSGSVSGRTLRARAQGSSVSVAVDGRFDENDELVGSIQADSGCVDSLSAAFRATQRHPSPVVDGTWLGTLEDGTPLGFTVAGGQVVAVDLSFHVCFDPDRPLIEAQRTGGLGPAFTIVGGELDAFFSTGAVPHALAATFGEGSAEGVLRMWNLECDLEMPWTASRTPD